MARRPGEFQRAWPARAPASAAPRCAAGACGEAGEWEAGEWEAGEWDDGDAVRIGCRARGRVQPAGSQGQIADRFRPLYAPAPRANSEGARMPPAIPDGSSRRSRNLMRSRRRPFPLARSEPRSGRGARRLGGRVPCSRARLRPDRSPRSRAAVPDHHRARRTGKHRHRDQPSLQRMGVRLPRPKARRHRRPRHLQRPHPRNRHRLLPPPNQQDLEPTQIHPSIGLILITALQAGPQLAPTDGARSLDETQRSLPRLRSRPPRRPCTRRKPPTPHRCGSSASQPNGPVSSPTAPDGNTTRSSRRTGWSPGPSNAHWRPSSPCSARRSATSRPSRPAGRSSSPTRRWPG